jgi:hypothetical protein
MELFYQLPLLLLVFSLVFWISYLLQVIQCRYKTGYGDFQVSGQTDVEFQEIHELFNDLYKLGIDNHS